MQFDRIEDSSIVFVGIVMHLQKFSVFAAGNPTATLLLPNAASTLVAFSLLMALSKWRPIRGPAGTTMHLSHRILRLLVELTTITSLVEYLLVRIWVPMLVALIKVCDWITEGYLEQNFPKVANFVDKSYYTIRFVLAWTVATSIHALQRWLTTISK
ncbi:hypothetical protein KR200_000441, partial [Drosophila serrata]